MRTSKAHMNAGIRIVPSGHSLSVTDSLNYRIRPNYRTVRLGFQINGKICGKIYMYPPILRVHLKTISDLSNQGLILLRLCDCFSCFFSYCLYKSICCRYSFELHRQVDAIQMGTHTIGIYKEEDKKYTGCNLKTWELLDCALIGICAVIWSNTVGRMYRAIADRSASLADFDHH